MIEILSNGLPNLIQDLGRIGHLSLGISRSGAMDPYALSFGNVCVGNDPTDAGIEITLFPFRVRFLRDAVFCCTGADCPVQLEGEARVFPPWWTFTAKAGQTLTIGLPRYGARAYLAIRGGIDVPKVLGSRATDLKTGFGGHEGRGLRRGDTLPLGTASAGSPTNYGIAPAELSAFWKALQQRVVPVRVLPAAEYDAFTPQAQQHVISEPYTITTDANRMGYRLSGEPLTLTQPLELLSYGIVPGTVQVPPAGQPIIQMAEANTCGGYPKIATVIQADLWKLGQAPIGTALRFEFVDAHTATQALQTQADERAHIQRSLALVTTAR